MIRLNSELAAILAAAATAVAMPIYMLHPSDPPAEHSLRLAATQLPPPADLALRGTALEAPLFNPDRTPPPAPGDDTTEDGATAAPPAAPPLLVGTIGKRGGTWVALVKNSAGETLTVHAGKVVDGWTVIAVGNGGATVDQNGRREQISLDFSNKGSGSQTTGQNGSLASASLPDVTASQSSVQNGPASNAQGGMIGQ